MRVWDFSYNRGGGQPPIVGGILDFGFCRELVGKDFMNGMHHEFRICIILYTGRFLKPIYLHLIDLFPLPASPRPRTTYCLGIGIIVTRGGLWKFFTKKKVPGPLHFGLSTASLCTTVLTLEAPIHQKSFHLFPAVHSDLVGLKTLFRDGLASPYDIAASNGRTALHVSRRSSVLHRV